MSSGNATTAASTAATAPLWAVLAFTWVNSMATGVPYKKIDPLELDMNVVTTSLNKGFARRHNLLPLKRAGNVLTVAVCDPYDTHPLEELARQDKSLESWTIAARKETGFVVPRPLCAAFLENAAGMQEWDPEHELVNRCAQLLLVRRFGLQPFWIQQGIGWCAEWHYDGSLYCFPFRREFVYATEHGAWPGELKQRSAKMESPFDWAAFEGWSRGRWDGERARLAFGALAALLQEPPPKLALVLEELRVFRDADNRRKTGEHSWERDPGYEIKSAKLAEVLQKHLGADIGVKTVRFLERGSPAYKNL
jgi:hypothetical protein